MGYWKENPLKNNSIEIIRSYDKEKDLVSLKLNKNLIVTTKLVSKLFKLTLCIIVVKILIQGKSLCYA
jgi:hypothetical protein